MLSITYKTSCTQHSPVSFRQNCWGSQHGLSFEDYNESEVHIQIQLKLHSKQNPSCLQKPESYTQILLFVLRSIHTT